MRRYLKKKNFNEVIESKILKTVFFYLLSLPVITELLHDISGYILIIITYLKVYQHKKNTTVQNRFKTVLTQEKFAIIQGGPSLLNTVVSTLKKDNQKNTKYKNR